MVQIRDYHSTDDGPLESPAAKAKHQTDIDDAKAAFFARGGTVQKVKHPTVEDIKATEWRNNSFVADINHDRDTNKKKKATKK